MVYTLLLALCVLCGFSEVEIAPRHSSTTNGSETRSVLGFSLKGMPEQAALSRELRDQCGYTALQIEATLSPFGRADGFE